VIFLEKTMNLEDALGYFMPLLNITSNVFWCYSKISWLNSFVYKIKYTTKISNPKFYDKRVLKNNICNTGISPNFVIYIKNLRKPKQLSEIFKLRAEPKELKKIQKGHLRGVFKKKSQ
jgi:hypothetical protein